MADEKKPSQQASSKDKPAETDSPVLDLQDEGETPEVEAHISMSLLSVSKV